MITRRVIASASLAAIGFTVSLVAAPHTYADGGLLNSGLSGVVTGVTGGVVDTVDTALDDTGLGNVITVEPGAEGGSNILDASVEANLGGIEAGVDASGPREHRQ